MKILVVSGNYPSLQIPNYGAFVYNLIQKLAEKHHIEVIAPFKIHQIFKKKVKSYGKEKCQVFRPVFISFSNKKIKGINFGEISTNNYSKAVNKVLRKVDYKPDIIYTHFLKNALPVLEYSKKYNIPIVVASGESSYTRIVKLPKSKLRQMIETIEHIICVSNENKEQLQELGFLPSKISVIPNAVDYEKFKRLDKQQCKKKLGVNTDKFIVGFIGHFINRKGPNRIVQAIKKINDPNIGLVCVGDRGEIEKNNFTKIIPPVANEKLPELYNAFDAFVLPTLHEGSCNVIEEAKACCLPIISSKGTSVVEQIIHGETGLLIDPLSIEEIAKAIKQIKEDKTLRNKLIDNLNKKIGENSLENRAEKISKVLTKLVR